MALTIFYQDPFITGVTEVGQIDTFTGDGIEDTFPLVNKTYLDVGSTIQIGTEEPLLWTGGFTKNNDDTITVASTPLAGSQGVIPAVGIIQLQAYDQATVEGVTDPLEGTTSVYFGDIEEIHLYKYEPRAGQVGIEILFVNNITSGGIPDLSWVSTASGDSLSWTASGVSLYTDKLSGFGTLTASSNSGTNTLLLDSATGTDYFIADDFVIINIGNPTAEIRRISSISYNTLTLSASFDYPHYIGEPVFSCLRQLDLRMVVPENFTANTAKNYYNISYKIKANQIQRS